MKASTVKRLLAWALAGVALAAVFFAYERPQMAFALASQLWNCF